VRAEEGDAVGAGHVDPEERRRHPEARLVQMAQAHLAEVIDRLRLERGEDVEQAPLGVEDRRLARSQAEEVLNEVGLRSSGASGHGRRGKSWPYCARAGAWWKRDFTRSPQGANLQ
jgi:hypothetical protein